MQGRTLTEPARLDQDEMKRIPLGQRSSPPMIVTGRDLGDIHPSVNASTLVSEPCKRYAVRYHAIESYSHRSPLSAVTRTTRNLVWNTSEFFWTSV